MYVDTARSSNAARSASGTTNQPTRRPGRDGLREGRRERDPLAALERVQRRRRRPLVADEAVGVVLEHVEVVLGDELDDPPPALLAERSAARVLERRDRVEERDRRRRGASSASSASGSSPSSSIGSATISTPCQREELQRPVVGRRLDEHAARPPRQLDRGVEDEALQAARRDEDARRVDAVPLARAARAAGRTRRPVPYERMVVPSRSSAAAARSPRSAAASRHSGAGSAARERDRGHATSL